MTICGSSESAQWGHLPSPYSADFSTFYLHKPGQKLKSRVEKDMLFAMVYVNVICEQRTTIGSRNQEQFSWRNLEKI